MSPEVKADMATVARYRQTRGKADPGEYMAYMKARERLAKANLESLSAGQRGFMAASRTGLPATSVEPAK